MDIHIKYTVLYDIYILENTSVSETAMILLYLIDYSYQKNHIGKKVYYTFFVRIPQA